MEPSSGDHLIVSPLGSLGAQRSFRLASPSRLGARSNGGKILKADTVIKLYEDYMNDEEHETQLREMLDFLQEDQEPQQRPEVSPGHHPHHAHHRTAWRMLAGCHHQEQHQLQQHQHQQPRLVLHLRENIEGNVFNRPYQYITIRSIKSGEDLPVNLKNDGDPMSDFFVTLREVRCRIPAAIPREFDEEEDIRLLKRFVVLAYKVLDDDRTASLDETWRSWTGASELLLQLNRASYRINGVRFLKGVNVIPDVFKYFVIIELNIEPRICDDDTYIMDCLQRFRLRRMSGYTALYNAFNAKDIQTILDIAEQDSMDPIFQPPQ